MPAKTEKQRRLMGLALHSPSKVSAENRGVLKMPRRTLREFARGLKRKRRRKQ